MPSHVRGTLSPSPGVLLIGNVEFGATPGSIRAGLPPSLFFHDRRRKRALTSLLTCVQLVVPLKTRDLLSGPLQISLDLLDHLYISLLPFRSSNPTWVTHALARFARCSCLQLQLSLLCHPFLLPLCVITMSAILDYYACCIQSSLCDPVPLAFSCSPTHEARHKVNRRQRPTFSPAFTALWKLVKDGTEVDAYPLIL